MKQLLLTHNAINGSRCASLDLDEHVANLDLMLRSIVRIPSSKKEKAASRGAKAALRLGLVSVVPLNISHKPMPVTRTKKASCCDRMMKRRRQLVVASIHAKEAHDRLHRIGGGRWQSKPTDFWLLNLDR